MTKRGFNPDKHKRVLTALLIDIVKTIGGKVAFKGGTAAMLFYNLPRLSVDLDFDILEELGDKDEANIQAALEKYGEIKEQHSKRFTLFFLLNYGTDIPNIKVEFNKRVWYHNSYQTVWLLGVPIQIADESTTLTNKLVSLTDRRSPVARDAFDCYFFLKNNWPINEELLKERTGFTKRDYLDSAIELIEQKFNRNNILAGIGDLLDNDQKKWVQEYLLGELASLLRQRKG